ncbi:LOW QUALITY PROTEIN: uncharacterized protein LOC121404391, partial [Drosophila obscura]|uniref:LOW QUALITY PROTEIN: uncharacterized protein LOC121404391 n=1 Tax=Drosophila obscura TaxID=7282 RepID=UPI001BB125DA
GAQHAYRKGKSTETALHEVISAVEKSLQVNEYSLIAFLDIEGAFNNVIPGAITEALTDLGVDRHLMMLIDQLLTCRTVTSSMGSSTQSRYVNRGTPQGGVLSPLLWNKAVNKILCDLEGGGGCKVVAYEDDVAIIFSGKFPQTLCDLMTAKLARLSEWTESRGLGINPSKTELVLFTTKYKIPSLNPPILNGCRLSFSDSASYLGLVIDKKLSWNLSIKDRVKKATIALYTCKKAIGLKWGMNPRIVQWIYLAIVRPILLYGVAVWWPALSKGTITKQLGKVQRTAALCISGALSTTPTDALNAILCLQSLDLAGKEQAEIAAIPLRDSDQWVSHHTGHASILNGNKIVPTKTDYCVPREYTDTPFETIIPHRNIWLEGPPGPKGAIRIFTDGSKLDNKVGGGIYSEQLNIRQSFRLPDHCSVFQAEVIAIKEALSCLQEIAPAATHINIYSDSQAAIKSLNAITTSSATVANCRKSLHEMAYQFVISLIWVPGHQDIEDNCIADELARAGTTIPLLHDKEDIRMPMATCKLKIKEHFKRLINDRWQTVSLCRITRQTWPNIIRKRTDELCKLSRSRCSSVIRSLTGHWLIGTHASRLGAPYNDFCRSCRDEDEEETVEHLFCSCPALSRRRLQYLGAPFLINISDMSTISPRRIAGFIRASGWDNG